MVAGAKPGQAASALRLPPPDSGGPVHYREVPLGTVVWSEAGYLATRIRAASATLGATIYHLVRNPRTGTFACWVITKGEDAAVFEVPASARKSAVRTDEILGERTPEGIIRALGVPW